MKFLYAVTGEGIKISVMGLLWWQFLMISPVDDVRQWISSATIYAKQG